MMPEAPQTAPAEVDRERMSRALRDLESARARVERDAKLVHDETRRKLVADLLPVVDNLDRTIRAATEAGDSHAVIDGVRIVRAQLESVLLGYGVTRVEALGARFDPKIHEAIDIAAVANPAHHAHVIDQIEPGYHFEGRLLRPAKVVVGRSRIA